MLAPRQVRGFIAVLCVAVILLAAVAPASCGFLLAALIPLVLAILATRPSSGGVRGADAGREHSAYLPLLPARAPPAA